MIGWLKRQEGSTLAIAGLFVAAILFVAVNVFSQFALRGPQLDLTENNLYTISDGTKRALQAIDEPISLRLYFSRQLGDTVPQYATYFARVRELLTQYADLAGGKIGLEIYEPEPFSEAEDQAVADGLQAVPLTNAGDVAYFGLAASNSTDGREAIPFFNLEREPFLEYDVTKLIFGLANPERLVVGVIQEPSPQQPGMPPMPGAEGPRLIIDQLGEFFEVEDLTPDIDAVPEGINVLVIIGLNALDEDALRAVDRFVYEGGRALVFVDPLVESQQGGLPPEPEARAGEMQALLEAWGVRLIEDKVAGDLGSARQVSAGAPGSPVTQYPPWVSLGQDRFDVGDPVMANIERLNLASAGILEVVEGAAERVTSLIQTSPQAQAIDAARLGPRPDFVGILRGFRPEGTPITLAARIAGEAKPAFPAQFADAAEPTGEAAEAVAAESASEGDAGGADAAVSGGPAETADPPAQPIRAIVVADVDMLYDRFWVSTRDFFGQQLYVPTANNADFVINAIEDLSGNPVLIGLRGRGTSHRPFTLIEDIRRDAELQFRAQENRLRERLTALEQRLAEVQERTGPGGEILLTDEDRQAIEQFRAEQLAVRSELRDVQRALRSDLEWVEGLIKALNIAFVPALLGVGALAVYAVQRSRRSAGRRATAAGGS